MRSAAVAIIAARAAAVAASAFERSTATEPHDADPEEATPKTLMISHSFKRIMDTQRVPKKKNEKKKKKKKRRRKRREEEEDGLLNDDSAASVVAVRRAVVLLNVARRSGVAFEYFHREMKV